MCDTINRLVVDQIELIYDHRLLYTLRVIQTTADVVVNVSVVARTTPCMKRFFRTYLSRQIARIPSVDASTPMGVLLGVKVALAQLDIWVSTNVDFDIAYAASPAFACLVSALSRCRRLRCTEIVLHASTDDAVSESALDAAYCAPMALLMSGTNLHCVHLRMKLRADRCLAVVCECASVRHMELFAMDRCIASDALVHNTTLCELHVWAQEGSAGAMMQLLVDVISRNKGLRKLYAWHYDTSLRNYNALVVDALRTNTTLEWISVRADTNARPPTAALDHVATLNPQLAFASVGHPQKCALIDRRIAYIDRLVACTAPPHRPGLYGSHVVDIAYALTALYMALGDNCVLGRLSPQLLYYLMDSVYFQTDFATTKSLDRYFSSRMFCGDAH